MPPLRAIHAVFLCVLGTALFAAAVAPMLAGAQSSVVPHDPGVRGGTPAAGGAISGLTANQKAFFDSGLIRFKEVDSVSGTIAGDSGGRVAQGTAAGDEFRTAPLWGVGQRIFFLHDGRTRDLLQAIREHDSPGSEADISVDAFNNVLTPAQQQDVLYFLRSL